jgi:hypothetical protein
MNLLRSYDTTEASASRPAAFLIIHASAAVLLFLHLKMETHFFVEFPIEATATEQGQ